MIPKNNFPRAFLNKLTPLRKTNPLLLLSAVLFSILLYLEFFVRKTPVFAEEKPFFTFLHFLRMFYIALTGFLFVKAFDDSFAKAGRSLSAEFSFNIVEKFIFSVGIILSVVFLAVFAIDPHAYYDLIYEDGIVENASFLFWISASGICGYLCVRLFREKDPFSKILSLITLGFCLSFFVIGMEEVSWLQRFFHYDTPGFLEGNDQEEANLHNFATDLSANALYIGTFILLVVIPFIHERVQIPFLPKKLFVFIPGRWALWVAAASMPLNYTMWNIFHIQAAFFITLLIMLSYYRQDLKESRAKLLLIFIVVFAGEQLVYLLFGDQFVREYDVTEAKEMWIALAFFFYSLELSKKMKERL